MFHMVYLGVGSNLGERMANLLYTQAALPPQVEVLAASPIYETAPWGFTQQPAFLNQVLQARTRLSPDDLLAYLKQVEAAQGRQATFRFGPRLIDVDILFYDDLVLESPNLVIPHVRLAERAFVLVPLADLAPDLRHPVLGKTIKELLAAVETHGVSLFQL